MDLKEEDILGASISEHWYYVAKGRAMRQMIGFNTHNRQVLDVGAGSGVFSRMLLDTDQAESAICVDPYYAQESREDHNGKTIAFVKQTTQQGQDLMLMMDVLEHVDDDRELLEHYADQLEPGARILITVPAFKFLWSGHDVFLEHRRRYTLGQVEDLVASAGLELEKGRYFFGLLFPVVALTRLINRISMGRGDFQPKSDLKMLSPFMNKLLIGIHRLEQATLFPLNRLFGLSVICLARKPKA